MGTRSGQIDPGVILYLCEQRKMSAAAVQGHSKGGIPDQEFETDSVAGAAGFENVRSE
jgi:hypothetical protein